MASYSPRIVEAYKALASYTINGTRGMPPAWPFHIVKIMWINSKFLPRETYRLMRRLENKGIGKKEQSKLFWELSALTQWLYFAQHGSSFGTKEHPFHGLTPKEGVDFIEKVLDLIFLQRLEDPFCLNQKNLLLKKEEVQELVAQDFLNIENSEIAKLIPKINLTLLYYCNLIQVAHRAYSLKYHGSYFLEDGNVYL